MRKPRRSIIALAGLTLILCSWHLYLSQEPQRALVDLLADVGVGASRTDHERAIEIFWHMNPYPGDRLAKFLRADSDSKAKAVFIAFIQRHGPRSMRRRFLHADDLRDKAAIALAEVGRQKGRVGVDLSPALNDSRPRVRYLATLVLAQVGPGPNDIPTLIGLIHDPDPAVRDQALIALGTGGARARDATAALMSVIRSQSYGWSYRSNACVVLARVAAKDEAVLQTLSLAATDLDQRVRQAAHQALADLKPSSE